MASRGEIKHGLLAAPLGMLVAILPVVVGTVAGFGVSDNSSGAVLPDARTDTGEQGSSSLLAFSAISGILILLSPLIGGAMGGACGARTGRGPP